MRRHYDIACRVGWQKSLKNDSLIYEKTQVKIENIIHKMETKSQKLYLTYYILLIAAQDLWQPHHQILSIIFVKKFIE